MQSALTEEVTIKLPKAACLILFELLTESYETWRKNNPDDKSASPMIVEAAEPAQRVSLWKLEGSLERTLPELFSRNYQELLTEARNWLTEQSGM